MKLFHRTSLTPETVLTNADAFFAALGLRTVSTEWRSRTYAGPLGSMLIFVWMEGGHYTLVEVHTDQIGESRLDKNVKKFFLSLHRQADPRHRVEAGY